MPEITWLKDGQPVLGEERLQVMSHGRFLHINNAQVIDTGRYSCLASNSAGDRSAHFNLNVLGTCVCVCACCVLCLYNVYLGVLTSC